MDPLQRDHRASGTGVTKNSGGNRFTSYMDRLSMDELKEKAKALFFQEAQALMLD